MSVSFGIIAIFVAHILAWLAACHALLTKRDPRSALGWTAALIFLPVIGLALYLVFGISRAHSRAEKIMREVAAIAKRIPHPDQCQFDVKFASRSETSLASLAQKLTSSPLCPGNKITALHNGDEAYPAMIKAINAATSHVYLSTYIFNYGEAAREFITALENAHSRGLDVRVLVDGVGALYSWRKPWRILADSGVRTTRFRSPSLIPPRFGINLRSHRKVLVCDHLGFTGGMNIADGNLLRLPLKHHIQDVQFKCEGPIVAQLRNAFLLNWSFCTGDTPETPPQVDAPAGNSHCRVVVDGPGDDNDALNDIIRGAINLSGQRIRIMTPYFLPTPDLMSALASAAQRGVDTRIILPGINNLAYMSWATQRILPELLKAGVRVWHQAPPFAHTKLLAMDDFYSLVGSANLDSRSLRLNFELNMEVYDPEFNAGLVAFMDGTIAKGTEIRLETLNKLPIPIKLRNSASWLFSPYF